MSKIWILSTYSYLSEKVVLPWKSNLPIPYREFNFWGGRMAGKTAQVINLVILLHLLRPDKTISFYGVRKKIENKKEFFDTVLQFIPEDLSVEINRTNRSIIHNKLYIEIIGLADKNKRLAQKLGKTRRNSDLTIVCFDEAFEFNGGDFLSVLAGVGSGKERMVFYCANPYDPSSEYFKKVLKVQPFTDDLKYKTSEVLFIDDKIFHFTNVYSVWNEIVSDGNKQIIEDAQKIDPISGEVVQYGRPLRLMGGIYTKELPHIMKINDFAFLPEYKNWTIVCGIDFGYSIDPTSVILGAISPCETKVAILDEFIIGTKYNIFDSTTQAFKILKFLQDQWNIYRWGQYLTVYCENDFAFVETLNKVSQESNFRVYADGAYYYFRDFVDFERVSEKYKKDRIATRIKATLRTMATGKFFIIKDKGNILLEELQNSQWEVSTTGKAKLKRLDENDHSINAFEYAFAPFIGNIGSLS